MCVCVCVLSHISLQERLFGLKMLSRTVARWGHFVPKSESQREHAHLTTHAQNHCMRALYCGLHCEKMEPWSPSLLSGTIDDLITAYFQAGHRYKKIVQFLCVVHGPVLSVRQLKRKLRYRALWRRVRRKYNVVVSR